MTRDDGNAWNNVTPPALTSWTKVVMIEASHFDANVAYVAVERHQLEDYEPYIYRTGDGGRTWQRITSGLPSGVYVQTVKEDPKRRGLLFTGTERTVFVSFEDGDHWQPLKLNLPASSVRDLAIKGDDLIAATHGRGFWIIDNITPLRQIDSTTAGSPVLLFKPNDTIAAPAPSDNGTPLQKDEPHAANPPAGAIIDYYLKSDAKTVALEILDSGGAVVRRYSSEDRPASVDPETLTVSMMWRPAAEPLSASAGMHRWVWDLRPTPAPVSGGRGGGGRGG
jgi:hypothetical protein